MKKWKTLKCFNLWTNAVSFAWKWEKSVKFMSSRKWPPRNWGTQWGGAVYQYTSSRIRAHTLGHPPTVYRPIHPLTYPLAFPFWYPSTLSLVQQSCHSLSCTPVHLSVIRVPADSFFHEFIQSTDSTVICPSNPFCHLAIHPFIHPAVHSTI
jgi:hypothetical protein